jgi:hypothetical protein
VNLGSKLGVFSYAETGCKPAEVLKQAESEVRIMILRKGELSLSVVP